MDSVFIARVSEEALTALSLAAPVQIIMSAMGLGMGVQSMLLTLSRQVIVPVILIAAAFCFGELSLVWWAFVLAEAPVIPAGVILWKKESGKKIF